jgi:FkbM family methyltransferase
MTDLNGTKLMKLKLKCGGSGLLVELRRLPEFQTVPYFLKHLDIDLVIDVGVNKGQFIEKIREGGYRGKIAGFEPLPAEFAKLQERFAAGDSVQIYPYALGNKPGTAQIHFGLEHTDLASLSQSNQTFRKEWGDVNLSSATVEVRRLDDLWDEVTGASKRVFLKIDTQGNDFAVLEGAQAHMGRILGLQTELSVKPIYENQKSLLETIDFLRQRNLYLHSLFPVVRSQEHNELMEVDGLFLNSP